MLRRLILTLVLAAAVTACTSVPTERAIAAHGVVLAPDRASANATARLLDDMSERLATLDAGLEVRPMEVWVFAELDDADVYGGYDEANGRILLDARRLHPSATLAHELVHAYEPASWARLPAVVREGLADHLAARAVPEIAAPMRASRAISLASYAADGLPVPIRTDGGSLLMTRVAVPVETDLTPLEALALPNGKIRAAGDGQTLKALYGMGLLIVSRAGMDTLVALAQEPGDGPLVAPQRILDAARLPADKAAWMPAIEGLLTGPEERRLVRRMFGLLAMPEDDFEAPDANMRD